MISRPVEKRLRLSGAAMLSEAELVAVLVGGDEQRGADVLAGLGGLHALGRSGVADLVTHGLTAAAACRLKAALELGRRGVDQPLERGDVITCADDVERRLRGRLAGLEQEELHVLGLDVRNRLMVHVVVSVGTINQVYASPRDVFRPLVREGAQAAIVVHNHPSGAVEPSEADGELTLRLAEAGTVVGVPLLDHVVVGREGRYSFAENRRIR